MTTLFGINLDVLYMLSGTVGGRWTPYLGAGPNFAVNHQTFQADVPEEDGGGRFDFSDTSFDAGFNFIAGARNQNGMFIEMKTTAYSVSVIRCS